ncbi:MAG: hypothetical protein FWF03_00155 [Defluviitaleaceae bacterium]|nr:hypothetical protein [Defluviitaleaceae bacterium]
MTKKYLNDYAVVEVNGKKKLEYHGIVYEIDMPPAELRRRKAMLVLNAAASAALFVFMGLNGNECTRAPYVGIPYALISIPALFALTDTARFFFTGANLKRVDCEGTLARILFWPRVCAAASAASLIGGAAFFLRFPQTFLSEAFFMPTGAALLASSILFLKGAKRIRERTREQFCVR